MSASEVVLVTGGNTGIGFEIIKALCKEPKAYDILVGTRSLEKGEAAITSLKNELPQTTSTVSAVQIDIESDDSIQKAFDHVSSKYGKLDVLVNNAGASFDRSIQDGSLTIREAFNKSWDVNVAGTQVMTVTFVPLLLKSSDPRLMFVTSGASTLMETENMTTPALQRINGSPPVGWPKEAATISITSYRSSKTGLNMLMREWYRILKNDGVKVWCISPGFLATGLGGVGPERLKMVCLELAHRVRFRFINLPL
jgi:NAD(P)-dependent dehydrogenase (short-subunit alcohol dehydrogenase family)